MIDRDEWVAVAGRYDNAVGKPVAVFSDKLREEAEHAVAGRIHYRDGEYVEIGRRDIDWTGSHIKEHVWRSRPKRFLCLSALMAGYKDTGDERYAEAARDYLADWMRAHPARPDWTMASHDNGLNLGIRVAFFAQALSVFAASPAWDDAFLAAVLEDIGCELRYIGEHLSPGGNFRMVQAMTLIECSLRLPFASDAAVWQRQGVMVMNDAARRQVLADGAHIECTAGYHSWMTQLFTDCLRLQREWPELAFRFKPVMVAAMFDYTLASTRPNGTFCGMLDIEGAWEGKHENPWVAKRAAFRAEHGLPAEEWPPVHQAYPVACQAFLRDGWEEDATYLTFDASRWGSAHCHLSRNAIQIHAYGRTLLMDPGRISYEMSNPLGPYAKSTRAHNTLTLNGWNQFNTNVDDFRAFHAPGFDCVTAKYGGGYWPAPYGWWFYEGLGHGLAATHTRHLFWVHGRWCVVIDEITRWNEDGRGAAYETPDLEVNWQFSPGHVELDAERLRAWTRHEDANLLLCCVQAPEGSSLALHEGEMDPPRGWVRAMECYGGTPAPLVSMVRPAWAGHVETIVTLLVPYRGGNVPEVEAEMDAANAAQGTPNRLRLRWSDGCEESVVWTAGLESMLGAVPEGETDGVLLYRRSGAGDDVMAAVDAVATESCVCLLREG